MTLEHAINLTSEGKIQEALDAYNEILRNEPDHFIARGYRAWLYVSMGKYREAIEDYRLVLEKNPEDNEARRLLAKLLYETGEKREAMEIMRELLQKNLLDEETLEICLQWSRDSGKDMKNPHDGISLNNHAIRALERSMSSEQSSARPETGILLYSIIRNLKPETVIETGTFIGYSALCITQAMEDNQRGHLHTFDLFEPVPDHYRSPFAPDVRDSLELTKIHLEKAGLSHRATLYKGDSSTEIKRVFSNSKESIDLAFIDGSHTIRGCLADWNAIIDLVKIGGTILLHDVTPRKEWWLLGPPYVLGEKCNKAGIDLSTLAFPTPDGAGLGMVRKISKGKHFKWSPSIPALTKELLIRMLNSLRDRNKK